MKKQIKKRNCKFPLEGATNFQNFDNAFNDKDTSRLRLSTSIYSTFMNREFSEQKKVFR